LAQETRSTLRKMDPRAALSTINPTLNPVLQDEGPFKTQKQSSAQEKG